VVQYGYTACGVYDLGRVLVKTGSRIVWFFGLIQCIVLSILVTCGRDIPDEGDNSTGTVTGMERSTDRFSTGCVDDRNQLTEKKLLVFSVYNPFTSLDETICITGNLTALGGWNRDNALELDSSTWPYWKVSLEVQAGQTVQYRYFLQSDDSHSMEKGVTRTVTVPVEMLVYHQADEYRL
jgi:hypothetical protein